MTMSDTVTNGVVASEAHAPDAPTVKKLTAEERYEIENCFLKVQNLALQTQKLHDDVQKAVQMRMEEQNRMVGIQARLGAKYNVDMTTVKIAPDGTIIEG